MSIAKSGVFTTPQLKHCLTVIHNWLHATGLLSPWSMKKSLWSWLLEGSLWEPRCLDVATSASEYKLGSQWKAHSGILLWFAFGAMGMSHKDTEAKQITIGRVSWLLAERAMEWSGGIPGLSVCSYGGVNTQIFEIWAKFKASEKALKMEVAV